MLETIAKGKMELQYFEFTRLQCIDMEFTRLQCLEFQHFENQDRHTVHIHMLVWLNKIQNIDLDHIRATVPKDNTFLAYLVRYMIQLIFDIVATCFSFRNVFGS